MATTFISSGATVDGTIVSNGDELVIVDGGSATNVVVQTGGLLSVNTSGTASASTVSGNENVFGGVETSATIYTGAVQSVASGGVASATILDGGTQEVGNTGSALGTVVSNGGTENVSSGGIASGTTVDASGTEAVLSGGVASATTVLIGGTEIVSSGGVASGAVLSGGTQTILLGGTADATMVNSGGMLVVSAGGTANDVAVTDGSITNRGLINGDVTFGGTTANKLVLDTTGVISGVVSAGGTASNTLELTGAGTSGTIANYATNFVGFQTLQVDAGSTWELTGATSLGAGVNVKADGTLLVGSGDVLTISGDVSFAASSGTLQVANGGILTLRGAFAAGEVVDLAGSASTVVLTDLADFQGVVANFSRGDNIYLRLPGSGTTTVSASASTLVIGNGGPSYTVQLDAPIPTDSAISLTDDGQGGTYVRLVPLVTAALSNDTGPLATDGVTNNAMFSGVADPNSVVIFTVPDANGPITIGSATADSAGAYSFTPSNLVDGAYTITATEADGAGNIGATELSFTLDTVAPTAPTALLDPASDGGVPGDNLTNNATPTITGSGTEDGDTVILYDDVTSVGSGVVTSGSWSITPSGALSDGMHSLTVTETDLAGNVSSASTQLDITIDTSVPVAPSTPALDPASDAGTPSDSVTNVTMPVITGSSATDGDTITLYDGASPVGTAVVSGGMWSVSPTAPLAAGGHTLTVTETNPAGSESAATGPLNLTIDLPTAPTGLALDPDSDSAMQGDNITSATMPTINGTGATDGDTVILYDGMTALGSATVASGAWSITPVAALADGVHQLTAVETDSYGIDSPASTMLDLTIKATPPTAPTALVLDPGSDGGITGDSVTDDTMPTITGSGELDGDTVTLSVDGTIVGSAVVSGGTWSIASAAPLTSGGHSFVAIETDQAGNVSETSLPLTLTIDLPVAPTLLTLDGTSDTGALDDNLTAIAQPMITGSGTSGNTVTLYEGGVGLGSGVVTSAGVWSITPTNPLADGPHDLTAVQTDEFAITSPDSTILTLTIDTTVPAAPTALDVASAINGTVGVTMPTITGTGELDGDTIALSDADGVLGTAVVSGGTWSIDITTPLVDGAYSFTATETDEAGNVSLASDALALTVDTTPPAIPSGFVAVSASNGIVPTATPTISGSGTDGDTVTVYEGATVIGSALVSGGAWSVTATDPLADGAHSFTATATDPVGNVSSASAALDVSVDSTAPAAPSDLALDATTDSGTPGDSVTKINLPMITGNGGADGDIITLYDAGMVVGSATVAGGTWSFTPTAPLADGVHSFTTTETDTVGYTTPASAPLTVTIDTLIAVPTLTAPGSPSDPAKPVIGGMAEAGSLVEVFDGPTLVGSATADGTGAWSYAFTTAVSTGIHSLTATATDPAGNMSLASAALALTVNADASYTVAMTDGAGSTVTQTYDTSGQIDRVETRDANSRLLRSVTNTTATLPIYDSNGVLIGTITQPSSSALSQPAFSTTGQAGGATAATSAAGSNIALLSENLTLTTHGNDTVSAGAGNDTIFAAGPTTQVTAGSGNLFLVGGSGSVSVTGGTGSSTVFGGMGGGSITGGSAGNNVLVAGGGNTTLVGGGAGDVLVAASGTTTAVLKPGSIGFGGTGNATLYGAENTVMVGGSNSDVMYAGAGPEQMWAGTGVSHLYGGTGDDTLVGGTGGYSTIVGGAGHNLIIGVGGTTIAYGGPSDDLYFAGAGDMVITEGNGSNQVVFGTGHAAVAGGTGTNLYTFLNGNAGGDDLIANFKVGTDHIQLFGYDRSTVGIQGGSGNSTVSLSDGTRITLLGVNQLTGDSILS